jgi:hypothetical protein
MASVNIPAALDRPAGRSARLDPQRIPADEPRRHSAQNPGRLTMPGSELNGPGVAWRRPDSVVRRNSSASGEELRDAVRSRGRANSGTLKNRSRPTD